MAESHFIDINTLSKEQVEDEAYSELPEQLGETGGDGWTTIYELSDKYAEYLGLTED